MAKQPTIERSENYGYYSDLLWCAVPLTGMAWYYYGLRPVLLMLAALVTAYLCDCALAPLHGEGYRAHEPSSECFAALIVLLMPASVSYGIVIVAVIAAVLVKEAFGGEGHYPFHPAAVGAAIAGVSWPEHVYYYPAPGTQLPFEGGHNFRELGGYEADEGKHIKWGQIYRGIPTWKLTSEADRKLLDSLGLRLILDLRSEAEAAETPDYVPDGARLVRICGLCLENGKEVDFSPEDRENLLKGMPDEGRRMADAMYERMLFGNKAYKELFRALEAGETPVLFHCSAGKDRTGVAAMLILLALGASDKTIAEDFEKTNIWRRPELEAVWAEHAEEIAADPARKDFYLGVFGVHPESAPFVLSIIRERYGSADAYLEAEYGLTPARLMRLRRMYLE